MANKNDPHWVLVFGGGHLPDLVQYSSRRTAIRGARRAFCDTHSVVVAEDGDTLEVWEYFTPYGILPDFNNELLSGILKAWNSYWRAKEKAGKEKQQ